MFGFAIQVEDPLTHRQYLKHAISSDDYTFTALNDGKYIYCFSNEGWTSNSKEVSFNVHGVVYVPDAELAQDPLDTEGAMHTPYLLSRVSPASRLTLPVSPSTFRGPGSS